MKCHLLQSLFCLLTLATAPAEPAGPALAWQFFAFDNGVGRGLWPASKQAETVKSLGYDGIHYNYTTPTDFATKITACEAAKVPIKAMYIYTFVDKPSAAYDPGIKDAIRMLKGSDTVIWMTLRDGKRGQQDKEATKVVREIAGLAAESGLKVSIYPHAGFYVATAEDAVRVVKQVDLPNVGVTINLCHELFAGNSERLAEVVKTAAPFLNLVSINGASPIPGKGPKAWDTLPLGSGTFDTDAFLRLIRDSGYRGPIGHQFFAVAGDDMQKLTLAIESWKKTKPAVLTPEPLRASH
ncbi:MAG: sugar phosphate isomerase/epimerase family protein [Luteolibacter sp.]